MEPQRPGPRPGALSDLEAKLLAAAVGKRLFQRPAEPVQLGRYRLLERLGQGGMGVVFRAYDPQLRRHVAVKLLHSSRGKPDREQQARLRREAQALGRLSHPNVVQVFEIGETDDHVFVAMELVRGATLRAWLAERPRSPSEILDMTTQAGRGIAAAHAAGIVHRDLKPENVLVGADGRARVVDFGLARAASDNPSPAPLEASASSLAAPLTKSGTVLGTPAFMAPEQVHNPTRADARSDQFSFCVLVYEALHGERPFDDLAAVASGTVRPAPAGSAVPPGLRAALLRGLRPDPEGRWSSMDELLATLEREAHALALPSSVNPPRSRRRLAILAALAAIVVLVATAWQLLPRDLPADEHLAAIDRRLADMLATGDLTAAERTLAALVVASPAHDLRLAAKAWASWARLLAGTPGRSSREAWAHAYVLARGDPQAQRDALLGLALSHGDAPEVLALLAAEAPDLRDAPALATPRTPTREPADHAQRLADAKAPREVVALATAGLVDLAAATLLTLAAREDPPTRRAWQLAAAPIAAESDDDARALALLADAAQEPSLQDTARAQQLALLLRSGRLDDAAHLLATRLADPGLTADARLAAQTASDRLATILTARTPLSLRFAGPDRSPWTDLDPSALRGDPLRRTLLVDAQPGTLAAWSLTLAADRLLIDLTAEPLALTPGAAFDLRLSAGDRATELGLRVVPGPGGEGELQLRCGGSAGAAIGPLRDDGAHPPLRLQLDLDLAQALTTCRVQGPDRPLRVSSPLSGTWPPGHLRLELRGGDATPARIELARIELTGARLAGPQPAQGLAHAGALLIDGDAHAAATELAAITGPRARLWHALALARLGRWQDAAPPLHQALADDPDGAIDRELQRWLRADPPTLAPALRQMLGERPYLELFARTWDKPLDEPWWSLELARLVLTELGGIEDRCEGATLCAKLLRARGRALLQIGERAQAQRALESALSAAQADTSGRSSAAQILVDLTLLKTSRQEPPARGETR